MENKVNNQESASENGEYNVAFWHSEEIYLF